MTKHGVPSVVMLSTWEYDKLKDRKNSLKDFFLAAPRVDLEITRSKDLGREVELLPQGQKRDLLEIWLEQLSHRFSGKVLPLDEEAALV